MPEAINEIQDPELPAAASTYADCAGADGLSLRDERARSLKTIRTCAIGGFAIKRARVDAIREVVAPQRRGIAVGTDHMPGEFRKISKRKPIAVEPHIQALTCPI